jgi:uncharacterized protein YgiM (DUF1202 family)
MEETFIGSYLVIPSEKVFVLSGSVIMLKLRRSVMRKVIWLVVILGASMVCAAALYAQTVYYVQSVKAKVMSGAAFKSPVIGEVAKGHKFVSSGREGGWIKVSHGGKDGYVSSLLLSTRPPLEKAALIKGEDAEIKQGVRRRASSYTSAAAARGLAADDRRRLSKEEKVDYESLEKMEAFQLSADEINRFMEATK